MNTYFTAIEIADKLNKKVKTHFEFSGVPKGTQGVVYAAYKSSKDQYGVTILWKRWEGDTLKDGFSKDEYIQFLEELPE